tara:strand:+ start:391 stop:759 length:369 start_codon:yes stop_codon:yes gene_type:complete
MEKIVQDLNLGWVKHQDKNGDDCWKCYDPETNELIGTYKDEELTPEPRKTKIEKQKYYAEKYKGVMFVQKRYDQGRDSCWESRVYHKGKRYYVGLFDCPTLAAKAYNHKILELGIQKELNRI